MQFSILFVNSTEICTLFSVQTVTAPHDYRAVSLYCNSEFLRLFACKNCRICPAPPTIGNISDCCWHNIMGLSPRHGSHPAAPTASNLWPDGSIIIPLCRSSRTDCHIGFGSCYLSLGYGSSYGIILSRSSFGNVPCLSDIVIQGTSWRSAPFAFNHYGLRKGKYLKYYYSIFNEQQRVKFNPLYISHENQLGNALF